MISARVTNTGPSDERTPPAPKPSESGAVPPTATVARTGRQRFLDACHCRPVDRPPVWLMRQAGRALPEYRALKARHSFVELVQTPELAAEVTLQPIRRFGFDAAVLFSDILVAAEGLGQHYRFRDQGGIELDFAVRTAGDIERLDESGVAERLAYLGQAVRRLRGELGQITALVGFAGSPWTLANFMMEGGSADSYGRAKRMFFEDRSLFDRLLARITRAVAEVLRLQIEAGADAVQVFDSLGELLPASAYAEASGRWIRQLIDEVGSSVPVIVFLRGAPAAIDLLASSGARVVSVDWRQDLRKLRDRLPEKLALQGNLDPAILTMTPEIVAAESRRLLESMRGTNGYIFNLGHGLSPESTLGNIEALVTTVRQFR